MKLEAGEAAPNFTLPDQEGKTHQLSDYRGRWVLLYFYPKGNYSPPPPNPLPLLGGGGNLEVFGVFWAA